MELRHRLHQRQAQGPSPACCAPRRRGRTARWRGRGRHPECPAPRRLTVISAPVGVGLGDHPHRAAGRRELHRVVDQVRHRLLDQRRDRRSPAAVRRIQRQADGFLLRHRAVQLGDAGQQRRADRTGAKAERREPASISAMRSSAWNTATIPSRSASRARSRRAAPVSAVGVQRGVLQPRARAGDRRAQIVGDGVGDLAHAVHQPADAVQHVVDGLGELVELVAAARQRHALRRSRRRRSRWRWPRHWPACGGTGCAPPARRRSPSHRRPPAAQSSASVSSVRELRAHLHVAADQQVEAVRQVVALHPGQRADAGALDRQLVPAVRHRCIACGQRSRLPAIRCIDRIDQQIDRVVIDVAGQPVLDRQHQRRAGRPRPALRQALRVGMDRRLGLPVEQAGRGPPQEQRASARGAERRASAAIDRGEADAGRARSSVEQADGAR